MIEKMGFPVGPVVDNLRASAEAGSIPGSGRSSGGSNGNPFQHSCLENPWRATAHGVTKNLTRLSGRAQVHN